MNIVSIIAYLLLLFTLVSADFFATKHENNFPTVSTIANKPNLKQCSGLKHAQSLRIQPQLCQLLKQYETVHHKRLVQNDTEARYLLLELDHPQATHIGFGNYANDVVNGFFVALFLNRTFIYTLPADIEENFEDGLRLFYRNFLAEAKHWNPKSRDTLHWSTVETLDENFWEGTEQTDILVANPTWGSYVVANFQANPYFSWFLQMYFPDFEVFSPLTQYLFQLKNSYQKAIIEPARSSFKSLNIGLQIRTSKYIDMGWNKKFGMPTTGSFFDLAKAVAARSGLPNNQVTFFVATDNPQVYDEAIDKLPGNVLRADNFTTGNATTELNSIVDMKLLSMCHVLIVTWASSHGYAAAGWGDHTPYVVIPRELVDDRGRPWYYQQLTSEPCHWPANDYMAWDNYRESFQRNPLWMHHSQCHPCMFHSRCKFRTELTYIDENPELYELYIEYRRQSAFDGNSTDPVDVDMTAERSGEFTLMPLLFFFLLMLPAITIIMFPHCRCVLPSFCCWPGSQSSQQVGFDEKFT